MQFQWYEVLMIVVPLFFAAYSRGERKEAERWAKALDGKSEMDRLRDEALALAGKAKRAYESTDEAT